MNDTLVTLVEVAGDEADEAVLREAVQAGDLLGAELKVKDGEVGAEPLLVRALGDHLI